MIGISYRNPPGATAPFDLAATVRATVARIPHSLRNEAWGWLPGQENQAGPMVFDQNLTREQIVAAKHAADETGTTLGFYLGTMGQLPTTEVATRAALRIYRGCKLAFDSAADEECCSPIHELIRTALDLQFHVGMEANRRQDWIDALLRDYGRRLSIFAEYWLWDGANPNRYTINAVRALGAIPVVLVTRRSHDRFGFPDLNDSEWAEKKVELCERFADVGAKIILRPTGMSVEQLDRVAAGVSSG